MSKALIAGINQVATDKGLDREIIFEAIEAALVSAYKRNYGSVANVGAEVDRVSGEMRVLTEHEVVDDVMNPRTEILEAVWHSDYDTVSNVVDQYVGYLRRKIDRPFGREDLQTVRGAGYRLRPPHESPAPDAGRRFRPVAGQRRR